jgi:hypothetical protein
MSSKRLMPGGAPSARSFLISSTIAARLAMSSGTPRGLPAGGLAAGKPRHSAEDLPELKGLQCIGVFHG